jgi:hypothetical protein
LLFDNGAANAAAWSWRLHLQSHWGEHATDALRMLEVLVRQSS